MNEQKSTYEMNWDEINELVNEIKEKPELAEGVLNKCMKEIEVSKETEEPGKPYLNKIAKATSRLIEDIVIAANSDDLKLEALNFFKDQDYDFQFGVVISKMNDKDMSERLDKYVKGVHRGSIMLEGYSEKVAEEYKLMQERKISDKDKNLSLSELAQEKQSLEVKEKQAKELLQDYESQQLENKDINESEK